MDPSIIGPATLSMTSAVGMFQSILPPLREVRKHSLDDAEFAADVRLGEVAAVGLALGIGAVTSSLTRSSTPIVVAAVMAGGLVFLYESTLRADRPFEPKGDPNALGLHEE